MFRAHSTALNSSLAASSQMLSMPMMLLGCMHCPYLDVGYGSARNSSDMYDDRYEWPLRPTAAAAAAAASPLVRHS